MTEQRIVMEISPNSLAMMYLQMILEQNYLSRCPRCLKVEFKDLPEKIVYAFRRAAKSLFPNASHRRMDIKGGERWISCRQTTYGLEISMRVLRPVELQEHTTA